jgi:hypothetical protein
MGPGPELQGEINTDHTGDTLIVDYDVAFHDADEPVTMDSLFLTLSASDTIHLFDTLIFRQEHPSKGETIPDWRSLSADKIRIAGQLRYADSLDRARQGSFRMKITDTLLQRTHTRTTDPFILYPSPAWGFTFSGGLASFDKSVFPAHVAETEGTLEGEVEAGVTGLWREWKSHLYGGGMGFPPSDDASEDDYISLGYIALEVSREFRFFFNRRLSPFVGGQYSHLEVVDHPGRYTLEGFGLSGGCRIGGTFDDLLYSYNSHLGGYHQFEYRAYYMASPALRIGTGYCFYRGNSIRAFRMRFYFEAAFGGYGSMLYFNRGNLVRDLLSWGFLSPIVLLGTLLDTLPGN